MKTDEKPTLKLHRISAREQREIERARQQEKIIAEAIPENSIFNKNSPAYRYLMELQGKHPEADGPEQFRKQFDDDPVQAEILAIAKRRYAENLHKDAHRRKAHEARMQVQRRGRSL